MSEIRCELSDLPVTQCACRIHGPAPDLPTSTDQTVIARYWGICAGCSEDIEPGDMITCGRGGYVHEECQ